MMPVMISFSTSNDRNQEIISWLYIFIPRTWAEHMTNRIDAPGRIKYKCIAHHRQTKAKEHSCTSEMVITYSWILITSYLGLKSTWLCSDTYYTSFGTLLLYPLWDLPYWSSSLLRSISMIFSLEAIQCEQRKIHSWLSEDQGLYRKTYDVICDRDSNGILSLDLHLKLYYFLYQNSKA